MREPSDIRPQYVVYFGIALLVLIALTFGGVAWIFKAFVARTDVAGVVRTQIQPETTLPPEPRLQVSPEGDNRAYLDEERNKLNQYGWVDREKGIARLPIERAMEIIAERGAK